MESKTLNYRAGKNDTRVVRVETQLCKREAGFWARTIVKFATGVPVLFLGPAMGGMIVGGLLHLLKTTWQPGSLACYTIACLIIIPILFIIEIRSRGEFFMGEARTYHTPGETCNTSLHYTTGGASDAEVGAAYIEVLLFAPRQILSAYSDVKQRTSIRSDEIHRAAEIVLALYIADGGVSLIKLHRAGESEESFGRILRYLQFYDWTDISKDGERTWLCSDAKKWL